MFDKFRIIESTFVKVTIIFNESKFNRTVVLKNHFNIYDLVKLDSYLKSK
jgi:hypothetical protein